MTKIKIPSHSATKVSDGINIAAAAGTPIRAGNVIGRVGATGQVQTSQLHFQLRKNRLPVDPMKQLPPR